MNTWETKKEDRLVFFYKLKKKYSILEKEISLSVLTGSIKGTEK